MGNTLHKLKQWCTGQQRLFYMLMLFCAGTAFAQSTVSGVVSDEKGMTIPGVSVVVKGTSTATTTDVDGNYSLSAPADATLEFSFIGFGTQEIALKGRTTVNVTLKEEAETISEVVVIGYGTQKKDDINSAVSSIRTKDIENLKQTTVDQMIQGKAAGVSVSNNSGQPGSAVSIRVRGTTSISGTNEPLYVIDGVPVSGDATNTSTSGRPIGGNDFSSSGGAGNNAVSPLSMINPNDIQSIDILKDASATAIYGSRGANGVIIITTKSGKKGTGKLTYEGYTSASTIYKKLDVMNLQQYAQHQNELSLLFGIGEDQLRPEFAHPELLGKGTNWQNEVFQTAITNSHQLSFSGGSESTSYYLSGGFLNQEGTLIGSGYKRYTTRFNIDTKVKDWLKVGSYTNVGITNEKITINQSYGGIISNTLLQGPDIPVRNPDGTYAGPMDNAMNATYFNPVAEALVKDNKLVRKNFMGNFYAEADIIPGLKYRVELGANTEFSENTDFTPTYAWGVQTNPTADLVERRQNWYSINVKNLLTYDKTFGKHHITLLVGQEANDNHWEGIIATATGFQTNSPHTINLADPSQTKTTGYKGSASLSSYFARAIYDFNSKYSFSASIRQDVSSKFDPTTDGGQQTGYFPAVSGSWRISNEPFLENIKGYLDNLKLRVGYGETGNQQIKGGTYSALLNQQNSSIGTGFLPSNISNPYVTWESMQQTNIGLDVGLFDRFSATIEVYRKKSAGFLFQVPLPATLTGGGAQYGGMDAPYSNLGSMENKGIDLTLGYSTKGEFVWNSTLVLTHYKNKLLSLQSGLNLVQSVNMNGYQPYDVTTTEVGHPIGMFYGYVAQGLYQTQAELDNAPTGASGDAPQLGDVKYKDIDGDGAITAADRTFIGNPHPDFTFGFTNSFKYKGFDLSVFVQGSVGNDIMNLVYRNGTTNAQLYQNQLTDALNYWTPENTNTNIPRPVNNTSGDNVLVSSRYIEDGSYMRIQNLTLGYTLPFEFINKAKLTRVRIYGTATNLHTFTKYRGYDPEVGSYNQNQLLTGIDNGRYPSPRTYSIGINVEF